MSRDLYAAYSGAAAAWRHLEVIANNVANANSDGFREARVSFRLAESPEPGSPLQGAFAQVGEIAYSGTDGALLQDGVSTHFALRGDGWFALQDGTYTRDGRFRLDTEGNLVTQDGVGVMSDGGPIRVQQGERLSVDATGLATGSATGELGRLRIVKLDDVQALGGNRWSGRPVNGADATVLQGAREASNADPMRGMVELLEASRYFEAQQKAMQASDEMRSRLNRIQG